MNAWARFRGWFARVSRWSRVQRVRRDGRFARDLLINTTVTFERGKPGRSIERRQTYTLQELALGARFQPPMQVLIPGRIGDAVTLVIFDYRAPAQ